MSPLGGGTGRTPAQHEQKQSIALFAAQGLTSPLPKVKHRLRNSI
ncbi:hypothetical protein ACG9ZL_16680 [Acinetobacter sp. ULE_I057]